MLKENQRRRQMLKRRQMLERGQMPKRSLRRLGNIICTYIP